MSPVTYVRAPSATEAVRMGSEPGVRLLGGGTNLVDLMRKGVEAPSGLIDVTALADRVEQADDGGLVIGAPTRNSVVAAHPLIRTRYPMLSRAILAGASAQVRNMATVGGNLMQRTRCLYFNDAAGSRCNKRVPGSGCDAIGGSNRYHAIIGGSAACVATHPSDMCVALAALDARVRIAGPNGVRTVQLVDFHRLPGDRPDIETVLDHAEMIVAIELPAPLKALHSGYRKVRDRASYAFALVSVAAGLSMQDGRVRDVRVAFGGIAPKPWRAIRIEEALRGIPLVPETTAAAIEAEFAEAALLPGNAFKRELAKRTLTAMLNELAGDDA
ncbi:xanthine dehydrogenase family protein subunit M [Novosphingobium sp. AP12]|uniref:FAD binding domain-containing protein n=1 Tax=Novosphingobium sp. AP12 TaxID=1144305 RepID=UPI000271DD2A|nr:xanthine dehydrogenase family protein subunit M [Novosphingobium sp. AP12]EJL33480.1 aerobic-type carbon monoxide dehydrogenase, middle subunit CoxM/CutM-like protein [Novosphingobium sp. AP12]